MRSDLMGIASDDARHLGPRCFTRRQVLSALGVAGASAVLAACGGGDNTPAIRVAPEGGDRTTAGTAARPTAGSSGQIGPDPNTPATLETDPLIWVEPQEVLQGASFLVAVDAPGAGFASVAFNRQVFTMLREGSRFFTILGLDALTPKGPLPVIISVADADGNPVLRRETIVDVQDAQWQTEVIELDEENQALLSPRVLSEDLAARNPFMRGITPERFWDDLFEPPSKGVITSGYGLRRSFNFRTPKGYHEGLDFAGDVGDSIVAPNTGVVAWVGQTRRRGNGVIIDHGGGVYSGYYHLSDFAVEPGNVVRTGDFVARMGATGLATGPHLHWEIAVHGVTVNPVQWLRINDFPNPTAEFDPADALPAPIQVTG